MVWVRIVQRAENFIKIVLTETIYNQKPIGRPRARWKDVVQRDNIILGRQVSVNLSFDRED